MNSQIARTVVFSFAFLASVMPAHAASDQIEAARVAATDWLAVVDGREYERAHETASQVMRDEVSQADWVTHVDGMREPLGKLRQRSLNSSEFHESLPDAPPGQYVIFYFDSSFENNETAAEVVAVRQSSDGVWRVIGYYFG